MWKFPLDTLWGRLAGAVENKSVSGKNEAAEDTILLNSKKDEKNIK